MWRSRLRGFDIYENVVMLDGIWRAPREWPGKSLSPCLSLGAAVVTRASISVAGTRVVQVDWVFSRPNSILPSFHSRSYSICRFFNSSKYPEGSGYMVRRLCVLPVSAPGWVYSSVSGQGINVCPSAVLLWVAVAPKREAIARIALHSPASAEGAEPPLATAWLASPLVHVQTPTKKPCPACAPNGFPQLKPYILGFNGVLRVIGPI